MASYTESASSVVGPAEITCVGFLNALIGSFSIDARLLKAMCDANSGLAEQYKSAQSALLFRRVHTREFEALGYASFPIPAPVFEETTAYSIFSSTMVKKVNLGNDWFKMRSDVPLILASAPALTYYLNPDVQGAAHGSQGIAETLADVIDAVAKGIERDMSPQKPRDIDTSTDDFSLDDRNDFSRLDYFDHNPKASFDTVSIPSAQYEMADKLGKAFAIPGYFGTRCFPAFPRFVSHWIAGMARALLGVSNDATSKPGAFPGNFRRRSFYFCGNHLYNLRKTMSFDDWLSGIKEVLEVLIMRMDAKSMRADVIKTGVVPLSLFSGFDGEPLGSDEANKVANAIWAEVDGAPSMRFNFEDKKLYPAALLPLEPMFGTTPGTAPDKNATTVTALSGGVKAILDAVSTPVILKGGRQ